MDKIQKDQIDRGTLQLHIVTLEAQLAELRAMTGVQEELKKIGKAIGSYSKQVELLAKVTDRVRKLRQLIDSPSETITDVALAQELNDILDICAEGFNVSEF